MTLLLLAVCAVLICGYTLLSADTLANGRFWSAAGSWTVVGTAFGIGVLVAETLQEPYDQLTLWGLLLALLAGIWFGFLRISPRP